MTGPEHYQAAEKALRSAERWETGDEADQRLAGILAAKAQVHATLALAAATVEALPDDLASAPAWHEAGAW